MKHASPSHSISPFYRHTSYTPLLVPPTSLWARKNTINNKCWLLGNVITYPVVESSVFRKTEEQQRQWRLSISNFKSASEVDKVRYRRDACKFRKTSSERVTKKWETLGVPWIRYAEYRHPRTWDIHRKAGSCISHQSSAIRNQNSNLHSSNFRIDVCIRIFWNSASIREGQGIILGFQASKKCYWDRINFRATW